MSSRRTVTDRVLTEKGLVFISSRSTLIDHVLTEKECDIQTEQKQSKSRIL